MESENGPDFVTIPAWVRRTGISRSKTYELLAAGELTARKVGRRTLIDLKAGLAWLDARPAPAIAMPFAKRPRTELL